MTGPEGFGCCCLLGLGLPSWLGVGLLYSCRFRTMQKFRPSGHWFEGWVFSSFRHLDTREQKEQGPNSTLQTAWNEQSLPNCSNSFLLFPRERSHSVLARKGTPNKVLVVSYVVNRLYPGRTKCFFRVFRVQSGTGEGLFWAGSRF